MRGGNSQDRRRSRRAADRFTSRSSVLTVEAAEELADGLALAEISDLVTFAVQGGSFSLGERDEAWDGPAAEKSYTLPGDGSCFMWKDPDGDPKAKSSYKFPFVSKDGGKHAVWKAITTIAGVLQGSMGGAKIPDADKAALRTKVEGFYADARKKYDDDKIQVPWKDGDAAADTEELADSEPDGDEPMSGKCANCNHMAMSHAGAMNDGACSMDGCDCNAFAERDTAALTPEALALERFDAATPRLFGQVSWAQEEGLGDLLHAVEETLAQTHPGETVEVCDVSVRLDKVIVSYGGAMHVVPMLIGGDGEPIIGDRETWQALPATKAVRLVLAEFVMVTEDGERIPFGRDAVGDFAAVAEVELPDAHKPNQRIPRRNASPSTPTPPAGAATSGPVAWEALFLPEATLTDDGRAFAPGAITWRDVPLSLMAMTETSEGGHIGAEVAGRIDRIWRDGNLIKAAGVFDDGDYGSEIARMVADGTLRGLSVDTAIHEYVVGPKSDFFTEDGQWIEQSPDAKQEEPSLVDLLFGEETDDPIFVVTDAVIGMATVCPFPAFAEANIALAASGAVWRYTHQAGFIVVRQPVTAIVAAAATAEVDSTDAESTDAESAGDAGIVPLAPPVEWFANPSLDALTPLTVTEDGRIFGHAWAWDTCHLSFPDSCVLAPRTQTDNSYFHLGEIECAEGETVSVGKITLDTGHAGAKASRAQAAAHYDHTGTVAAHVRCGEDDFGGWVAGAVEPGISPEKLRILRGAVLSGDWRAVRMANGRSNLELVALLAVNVPGFPVPRQPTALMASGENGQEALSLTAAGVVVELSPAEEAEQELAEVASLARQASGDCGCS